MSFPITGALRHFRLFAAAFCVLTLSGCAETELVSHYAKKIPWGTEQPKQVGNYKIGNPYKVGSVWYYPEETFSMTETGIASWYGPDFHGKKTANGEIYNQNELTAAHRTLQMPSLVRVTNLENGKSIVVRINDRGPFKHGRIIDLSSKGADLLGFKNKGTARVKLEVLGAESREIAAAAKRGMDVSRVDVASIGSKREVASLVRTAYAEEPLEVVKPRISSNNDLPESLQTPTITVEELAAPGSSRYQAPPPAKARAVASSALSPAEKVAGHMDAGRFMPDPVVTTVAAPAQTGLFVQAGSFSVYDNADRLSASLRDIAPTTIQPITIQGRKLYRVKLGPLASIDEADAVLDRVIRAGNDTAKVVRGN